MGFREIFGEGAKIFGGKVHPSLELRVFRHPWSRSDSPCSKIVYIAICHRRKCGQVWGPQFPYQKSHENSAAGRHPFGPLTITWKTRNHSAM